ncbi:MAG: hypothetical protein ACFFD7_09350 [Candidatus Thorarchaeota archaeon]
MAKPTKEDAALLVQIFATGISDQKFQEASNWFVYQMNETNYDDFKKKYPIGSEGYRHFMKISSYTELLGVLVNHEVLSEDLLFEMYGDLMWDKAEPIVRGLRKELGMPRFLENYEVYAKKFPEWEKNNPARV